MKVIITIDDATEITLKNLLKYNVNIPIIIGVPVGLIGKCLEGRKVADKELLLEVISKLNVKYAIHGYYHKTGGGKKGIISRYSLFLKRFLNYPDKRDYLNRLKEVFFKGYTSFIECKAMSYSFDINKEVVDSKKELLNLVGEENLIDMYIYPGGYIDEFLERNVKKTYLYARTSEIGYNFIDDLKGFDKYRLKTISFSKFTNFEKIKKYYNKLFSLEKTLSKEILVIESYHDLVDEYRGYLYENRVIDVLRYWESIINFMGNNMEKLFVNYVLD